MKDLHAVSVSGGKDSTALLLLMIEHGLPIDVVLYADTGMEFPEMKEHMQKLDELLFRERGLHITTLRHPLGFEWFLYDVPLTRKKAIERRITREQPVTGYGWPGPRVRWCTGHLKTKLVDKFLNQIKGERRAIQFAGIAADESHRCKEDKHKQYPLVDWGITEAQALQICYDKGFDWGGLYEIYDRCSCWCCPLQRIGELRKLRQYHPDLWRRLLDMDRRAVEQFGDTPLGHFRSGWTVEQLGCCAPISWPKWEWIMLDSFSAIIRKYVGIKELAPAIVNEFIKKIIVHAPEKVDGKRVQKVDIVFNFVGEINFLSATQSKRQGA